jgi:hypothetical protein
VLPPIARLGSVVRRLRLVLLGALVLAGGGLAAGLASRAVRQQPPDYAVIYGRERYVAKANDSAIDIYWQLLPRGTPRRVYTIPPRNDRPRTAGYLPSPDGRWLYVWHGTGEDEYGQPMAIRFLLVSVPDGETVPMAEVKTYRRRGYDRFVLSLAPVWLDSNRLLLETSFGSGVFDLRTRTFKEPLPAWPPQTLPEPSYQYTTLPTPEAFVREHYADDLECTQKGLAKFGAELGLKDSLTSDYDPDTLESMLARPLGVTRPRPLPPAGGGWLVHPELACSPNHRYLARAAVLPTDTEVQRKDLRGQWRVGHEVAVRLDFLDLTGRDQFESEVENVLPRAFAEEGKPFRPFSLPRLGDLRFSPDGRFFSYTAYDILPPHGHPSMRIGTAKVQGRSGYGFPTTGVYIRDAWWAAEDPEKADRESHRYEWLYFIPDAVNAFVVPAAKPPEG